jgi:hypothetical protein
MTLAGAFTNTHDRSFILTFIRQFLLHFHDIVICKILIVSVLREKEKKNVRRKKQTNKKTEMSFDDNVRTDSCGILIT